MEEEKSRAGELDEEDEGEAKEEGEGDKEEKVGASCLPHCRRARCRCTPEKESRPRAQRRGGR